MSEQDRIDRLIAEVEALAFTEREEVIASLSDEDRAAVWDSELKHSDAAAPKDDAELGGEG